MTTDAYKHLFESAISALAAIDRELGLPDDGCNATALTIAEIQRLKKMAAIGEATLHKIIASVEAALDAAGAPAGTLVERIGALAEDAARWRFSVTYRDDLRMNWLVVYDEWDGDGDARRAIDAARTQTEIDMIGTQSTGAGANHA